MSERKVGGYNDALCVATYLSLSKAKQIGDDTVGWGNGAYGMEEGTHGAQHTRFRGAETPQKVEIRGKTFIFRRVLGPRGADLLLPVG
jgi:hypothetical protein